MLNKIHFCFKYKMPKNNLNYLTINLIDLKLFVLNCINNLKGQDIICLDMNKYNNITELMVLCTGQTNRHVISIAQNILYTLRNKNYQYYGIEGLKFGEWILIDLGNIVIHIMNKETRQLYALEKLWSDN